MLSFSLYFGVRVSDVRTGLNMQDEKLREQCLKLTLACLSYDFFGTSSDESTEDVGTVQVCERNKERATFSVVSSLEVPKKLVICVCVCTGADKLAVVDRGPKHDGDTVAGLQHISSAAISAGDGVFVAAGVSAQVALSQPRDTAGLFTTRADSGGGSAARTAEVGRRGKLP